jgi:hypothetical protein
MKNKEDMISLRFHLLLAFFIKKIVEKINPKIEKRNKSAIKSSPKKAHPRPSKSEENTLDIRIKIMLNTNAPICKMKIVLAPSELDLEVPSSFFIILYIIYV